jgi:hypothetical protein
MKDNSISTMHTAKASLLATPSPTRVALRVTNLMERQLKRGRTIVLRDISEQDTNWKDYLFGKQANSNTSTEDNSIKKINFTAKVIFKV